VLAVRLPVKRQAESKGAAEKRRESFRNRRLAVLEARSALDAAAAKGLVDSARVAALGASMGGGPAIVFGAVEPRAKAVAALSTGADDVSRTIPERAGGIADNARRTVASVDPLVFAPHLAPRPFLLIRGEADADVSDASARALLNAAREPKAFVTLPGAAHRFDVALAAPELLRFLRPVLAPPGR
jgi:fermentation-respiration switch protein FrsA (DUF1100 family)